MKRILWIAFMLCLATGCDVFSPDPELSQQPRSRTASRIRLVSNEIKYRDAGKKPGLVREGDVTLQLRALLGSDGKTLVELTTGELDSDTPAPLSFEKIQIKFLNPATGEYIGPTYNFNHLAQGGYFSHLFEGLARNGLVEAQANVRIGKNIVRMRAATGVYLRPDPAIVSLDAPEQAVEGENVLLNAIVREMNGDVGARANCVLYVDEYEVDRANGIWVDAGDQVSCSFMTNFLGPGPHQARVALENVLPTDWDSSNNQAVRDVEVRNQEQVDISISYLGGLLGGARGWQEWKSYDGQYRIEEFVRTNIYGYSRSELANMTLYTGINTPVQTLSFSTISGPYTLDAFELSEFSGEGVFQTAVGTLFLSVSNKTATLNYSVSENKTTYWSSATGALFREGESEWTYYYWSKDGDFPYPEVKYGPSYQLHLTLTAGEEVYDLLVPVPLQTVEVYGAENECGYSGETTRTIDGVPVEGYFDPQACSNEIIGYRTTGEYSGPPDV